MSRKFPKRFESQRRNSGQNQVSFCKKARKIGMIIRFSHFWLEKCRIVGRLIVIINQLIGK